jgi:hypothetical protein
VTEGVSEPLALAYVTAGSLVLTNYTASLAMKCPNTRIAMLAYSEGTAVQRELSDFDCTERGYPHQWTFQYWRRTTRSFPKIESTSTLFGETCFGPQVDLKTLVQQ